MSVRKYILERSLLQPADIILTGDKGGVSLSVRAATISRYSHAAFMSEILLSKLRWLAFSQKIPNV